MTFEGLTPIGCVVVVLGVFWGTCFLIALPLFLIGETLDNLAHGSGWFGVYHTIGQVLALLFFAPFYLAALALSPVRRATGSDRPIQEPTDPAVAPPSRPAPKT